MPRDLFVPESPRQAVAPRGWAQVPDGRGCVFQSAEVRVPVGARGQGRGFCVNPAAPLEPRCSSMVARAGVVASAPAVERGPRSGKEALLRRRGGCLWSPGGQCPAPQELGEGCCSAEGHSSALAEDLCQALLVVSSVASPVPPTACSSPLQRVPRAWPGWGTWA